MKKSFLNLFRYFAILIAMLSLVVGCSDDSIDPVDDIKVVELSISTAPDKVEYVVEESLSLTGLSVKRTYSDNTNEVIGISDFSANGISCNPATGTTLTLDNSDITITDTESSLSVKQGITVTEKAVVLTGLTVKTPPAKVQYSVGDKVDLTDLVIEATYDNGDKLELSADELSAKGIEADINSDIDLTVDHTEIIFTHAATGITVNQTITVTAVSVQFDFKNFAKSFDQCMIYDIDISSIPRLYKWNTDYYQVLGYCDDMSLFIADDYYIDLYRASLIRYEHDYSASTGVIESTTAIIPSFMGENQTIVIDYEYDADNRELTGSSEGYEYRFSLDEFGRIDNYMSGGSQFSYDSNGNLIQIVPEDANDNSIIFAYNDNNECYEIEGICSYEYNDGKVVAIEADYSSGSRGIAIGYDSSNNVSEMNYTYNGVATYKDLFSYDSGIVTHSSHFNDLKVCEFIYGDSETLSAYMITNEAFEDMDDPNDFTSDTEVYALKMIMKRYESEDEAYPIPWKEEWYEGEAASPILQGSVEITRQSDDDYDPGDYIISDKDDNIIYKHENKELYDMSGTLIDTNTYTFEEWLTHFFESYSYIF